MNKYVINSDENSYNRALKREKGIWSNFIQDDFINKEFHEVDFLFNDEKFSFRNNYDWINFLQKFGPFKSAIILGGGNTSLENYLLQKGIVENIKNLDIINDNSSQINKFNDLNFTTLPEGEYDLVIAKSILHHIINLEHLLLEVNKSLKEDGVFMVFEYVGENKQQWSKIKINTINKINIGNLIPGFFFSSSKHNYYNDWPFESIRSQDIPNLLNEIFKKGVEVTWGSLRWPIDYYLNIYKNRNKIEIDYRLKEEINKLALENEIAFPNLQPCYLFGIYNKSFKDANLIISRWDKKKIIKELKLNGPLKVRYKSFINTYKNVRILKVLLKIKSFIK